MKNDKESEYFMLLPTNDTSALNDNEFVLVISKGDIRKPVLITYPRNSFDRKLRYFKKISWN